MGNAEKHAGGRPRRDDFDPQEVKRLRDQAVPWRQIAARLRVGVGTARRSCKELAEDPSADSLTACQNSGGPVL
jgi:hypothetical protein